MERGAVGLAEYGGPWQGDCPFYPVDAVGSRVAEFKKSGRFHQGMPLTYCSALLRPQNEHKE